MAGCALRRTISGISTNCLRTWVRPTIGAARWSRNSRRRMPTPMRASWPQPRNIRWKPHSPHKFDSRIAEGSVDRTSIRMNTMAALEKGITRNGTGYSGKTWIILGQVYFPKAVTDSTFAFETNSDPGQFVPVHIHPTQDEFILVQDGMLDLKLDGVWVQAKAGDLVRLPRGIPHGYFNKSDKPARALFWVSPTDLWIPSLPASSNSPPAASSAPSARAISAIACGSAEAL